MIEKTDNGKSDYQHETPALAHSGFDYLSLGSKLHLKTGDWDHQLHHQYFSLNYRNTPMPFDKLCATQSPCELVGG